MQTDECNLTFQKHIPPSSTALKIKPNSFFYQPYAGFLLGLLYDHEDGVG
jgi:hypothetical protein